MASTTRENPSVMFLIGAGASIPCGMPSTTDITERVLSGKDIIHHSDDIFYPSTKGELHDFSPGLVSTLVVALQSVALLIEEYYEKEGVNHSTNFEDLLFVIQQVFDASSLEYDNPAIKPTSDRLFKEFGARFKTASDVKSRQWSRIEVFRTLRNYVIDVVWHSLYRKEDDPSPLMPIAAACTDTDVNQVDICTLNHDLLIETILTSIGISYEDGFGPIYNSVRYWNRDALAEPTRPRLLKLHGSIDWFWLEEDSNSHKGRFLGQIRRGDIWHTINPDGKRQLPIYGRPLLLAGTFNKMISYYTSVFADIHEQFSKVLQSQQDMVVIGYGFRDKGINSRIIDWMSRSSKTQMVIVHAEPEKLWELARGAIPFNINVWQAEDRVRIIPKWIQDTNWQEIKNTLWK